LSLCHFVTEYTKNSHSDMSPSFVVVFCIKATVSFFWCFGYFRLLWLSNRRQVWFKTLFWQLPNKSCPDSVSLM